MKSKILAKTLSCILAMAMICSIGAAAAQTHESGEASHGMIGGTFYQFRSTLYADSGSQWRSATWMQVADGKSVPAGYMKAKTFLYDASGNLLRSTVLQANTTEAKFLFVVTPAIKGTGEYVSEGQISNYFDGTYTTMQVPRVTNSKTDVIKALEASLGKDGSYPVNAKGQTYGSALLRGPAGFDLDLIAAIGTDNVKGYVRTDELDPYTATPEEAVALAASAKSVVLPLYDLNGKVIGTFVQDAGVSSNSKAFAGSAFDTARKKAAAGSYAVPAQTVNLPKTAEAFSALAEKALSITPYSRNGAGRTYGSETMRGAVGYSPDLIGVLATNNETGYVKKHELRYAEEHVQQDPACGSISVFDLNGKVIGEFKIGGGRSSNDPEFAGLDVDAARAKLAAG